MGDGQNVRKGVTREEYALSYSCGAEWHNVRRKAPLDFRSQLVFESPSRPPIDESLLAPREEESAREGDPGYTTTHDDCTRYAVHGVSFSARITSFAYFETSALDYGMSRLN